MNARARWLEYSDGGGPKSFAEWCAAVVDPEVELHDKLRAVLDDPELLAALAQASLQPRTAEDPAEPTPAARDTRTSSALGPQPRRRTMKTDYIWQMRAGLDDEFAVPPTPPKEDGYMPTKCPLGTWHPFALPSGDVRPTPANTTYRRCLEKVVDDMPY